MYENFLHAVIHINHTKIFLRKKIYHENFLHENKVNYSTQLLKDFSISILDSKIVTQKYMIHFVINDYDECCGI